MNPGNVPKRKATSEKSCFFWGTSVACVTDAVSYPQVISTPLHSSDQTPCKFTVLPDNFSAEDHPFCNFIIQRYFYFFLSRLQHFHAVFVRAQRQTWISSSACLRLCKMFQIHGYVCTHRYKC